jgi:hypothetical protein
MHKNPPKRTPLKGIAAMAAANLDAWFHSPRVWMMMICVAVYCLLQASNDAQALLVNGNPIPLTYPEMLFWELDKGFSLMSSLLFLIMVSELPRRIGYQNHMLVRTTRLHWVMAQCLYCMWMVLSMILMLILLYSIFALPHAVHGSGFVENELIQAGQYKEQEALIPTYIRQSTTPITACLLAILPMFFFWITMVLIILLFGLMGLSLLGPLIYGFLLLAHVTLLFEAMPSWLKLPIDFSSLHNITAEYPKEEFSRLRNVLAGYIVLDGLLIAILCLIGKKAELVFFAGNKE